MSYVDGFVLAVPKANLETYKDMARLAGSVWMEHGALAYAECIGDDVPYGDLTSFPRAVQAKDDEVVVFSWITYPSRKDRDAILKKVMADPRLKGSMDNAPFDGKRMIYGGFEPFMQLQPSSGWETVGLASAGSAPSPSSHSRKPYVSRSISGSSLSP
ncbi:MAG: DUF1428 family protein [Mesorhizobium sp.]|nr:DUF1428 family protein [Mesorhizobium sp.]